jgi:molecular chaperone GrpE (heat shock protein)
MESLIFEHSCIHSYDGFKKQLCDRQSMADDDSQEDAEDIVQDVNDDIPVIEVDTETMEVTVEEVIDPLEAALSRAEKAEKEIAYKEAETQNVRKRMMSEKAELIQYGGMGIARKMLTILSDVDYLEIKCGMNYLAKV